MLLSLTQRETIICSRSFYNESTSMQVISLSVGQFSFLLLFERKKNGTRTFKRKLNSGPQYIFK